MILKNADGTVVEMTVAEFAELGELYGGDVEAEAVVEGNTEATTEFKVGDKVKVLGKSIIGRDEFIGKTAIIARIYEDGDIEIDEGGYLGSYNPSSLKLIEEEPEVLSEDNVKVGEYFVITDNTCSHNFAIGEVIKAKSHTGYARFKAKRMDESNWWYVKYTDVRRATDAEIAEATKPKFGIGDVVKVGGSFAKVTSEVESDGDCFVIYLDSGENSYYKPSAMRHATEEEKSHLQTLIGREKDEYKIGDLVELLGGGGSGYSGREGYIFEVDKLDGSLLPIHLKDNGNKTVTNLNTWSRVANLKLITPVEWRHDFVGGA